MKTRAEFLGHPIHQMMIVLPLGLLATAATCDVISVASRNRRHARGAYYMQSAGLLTGLGAAVPGAIDWWDIPRNTREEDRAVAWCRQPNSHRTVWGELAVAQETA